MKRFGIFVTLLSFLMATITCAEETAPEKSSGTASTVVMITGGVLAVGGAVAVIATPKSGGYEGLAVILGGLVAAGLGLLLVLGGGVAKASHPANTTDTTPQVGVGLIDRTPVLAFATGF